MREESFFVEFIGPSFNAIMGAKSKTGKSLGVGLYIGAKKKVGDALVVAGVKHIAAFTKPVEIWYFPRVAGSAGRKEYDCLNFSITYKLIEDWLVKFKVITDDNRDWVHWAHLGRPEIAEDGIPGIRVVVRELDAPSQWQDSLELVVTPEIPF